MFLSSTPPSLLQNPTFLLVTNHKIHKFSLNFPSFQSTKNTNFITTNQERRNTKTTMRHNNETDFQLILKNTSELRKVKYVGCYFQNCNKPTTFLKTMSKWLVGCLVHNIYGTITMPMGLKKSIEKHDLKDNDSIKFVEYIIGSFVMEVMRKMTLLSLL